MSLLQRSAPSLRLHLKASYSPPPPTLSLRRWIYNPILNPPATTGPALNAEFRRPSAPHLPPEKFREIVNTDYDGLTFRSRDRPGAHTLEPLSPEQAWLAKSPRQSQIQPPPDQFGGRSIFVRSHEVALAWNRLQSVLRQNNIRRELRMTERHEKKGVKRRRLRSERWKRKFSDEVRKKVKLVNEIRLRDRMWGARH